MTLPQRILVVKTSIFFYYNLTVNLAGGEMCTCADWHGCIMKSSLSGEDGIQPFKFSECSFKQFQRGMEKGSALCLLNR